MPGDDYSQARALLGAPSDELSDVFQSIMDSWPPGDPDDPTAPLTRLANGFSELASQLMFYSRVMLDFYADELGETPEDVLSLLDGFLTRD